MLDSWSVYLTLYRMICWTRDLCIWHYTEWPCWTRDLCIWHYTEWRNVGLVYLCIWHYTEWHHVGLVICVSDIIQNDAMLDLWSVYLTLYRMMLDSWCWTRDLCIWHYTEWRMLDSWSVYLTLYRMTRNVGLVICVSDIIQNDVRLMLDSWSMCIWHYTEWR